LVTLGLGLGLGWLSGLGLNFLLASASFTHSHTLSLHEARNKPVQAATSHFTTMTVDGQNRDLVNFWRNVDIDGGDQQILCLGPVKRGGQVPYTLNHWSKDTVSKIVKFEDGLKGCTLQIIPSFYKAGEI
jgi:hypothetical protein